MAWNFGLLGASAAALVNYELLSGQVLTSSAASVTFSGLDNYTDYERLQIRAVTRTTRASSNDDVYLNFNSDFGSNYARHELVGIGTSVNPGGAVSQTNIIGFYATAATETANSFGVSILDILDFSSSSKNTTIKSLNAFGTNQIRLDTGLWINTSAVTSLTLNASVGDFIAGSRFSLMGVK